MPTKNKNGPGDHIRACLIAGIGVENGAQTALLYMKNINLEDYHIRILGVNFLYNEQIYQENNFLMLLRKQKIC